VRAVLRRYGAALGVAAVFVALFALLMPSLLGRDTTRDHSALRKNRWGCAALAELCRQTEPKLRVTTLTRPLDDLKDVHGVLLILDPERPFADAELKELIRWVDAGGVLVAAVEGFWDDPGALGLRAAPPYWSLLAALGLKAIERDARLEEAAPVRGSTLVQGVRRVAIRTRYTLEAAADAGEGEASDEELPEYAIALHRKDLHGQLIADGRLVMASFRHGKGEVFVSSDAEMFANAMLGREDNLRLVANLIWPRAAGGVYFDEYHHGFGARVASTTAPDPGPLNRALIVVAVGFAVFLFGKAVRFGAPVAVFDPRRRATMEYVDALAGLFRRGQANEWALQKMASAFRRRLAASIGLPATVEAELLATALAERRGIPAEEVLGLVRDVEGVLADRSLGHRGLADLVNRMTDLEERARMRR
jgi:hypothetical protein